MRLRALLVGPLLAGLLTNGVAPAGADDPDAPVTEVSDSVPVLPTVIEVRRLGTSVEGRPIRAYHLGDPTVTVPGKVTAVVLGAMHGNEQAGMRVVSSLRAGDPVRGIDLWVIPTMNPDGVAHDTRGNAHGIDLNRNFPFDWAPLTGNYSSGPKPLSEPESRAMRRFLRDVRPTLMVSFHQPLHGIGRSGERRAFQRRLSRGLGLPLKAFNCTGHCTGTMTSWFNHAYSGTAITVEFGASPRAGYLRGRATRGTLHAFGGRR